MTLKCEDLSICRLSISLICSGKGNEDWNCSAPHGAGRLMSRKAAFNALSMEEFQKEMEGIYTTCVVPDTLDESPMAYKSMEEIVAQIGPTAEPMQRDSWSSMISFCRLESIPKSFLYFEGVTLRSISVSRLPLKYFEMKRW